MPIFEYQCNISECNHKFDHLILSSRKPEEVIPCEKCGKEASRILYSGSSFNSQFLCWDRVGEGS
jgi:putative FmdB family regulatory protein